MDAMLIQDEPTPRADALIKLLISSGETRQREFKRVSGKMVGKALETDLRHGRTPRAACWCWAWPT